MNHCYFLNKEANVALKIYKTLIRPHIEYCASVSKNGDLSVIWRLEGIQRKLTKIIKRVKDYSYRERLKELRLTTLQKEE